MSGTRPGSGVMLRSNSDCEVRLTKVLISARAGGGGTLRRHLAGPQFGHDPLPGVRLRRERRRIREQRQVQSGVGFLLVMAAGADFVEHGAHVAIEDGRDGGLGVARRPGRDEAQPEHERQHRRRHSHADSGPEIGFMGVQRPTVWGRRIQPQPDGQGEPQLAPPALG